MRDDEPLEGWLFPLQMYAKVQLRGDPATRTIGVLPERTLSALHHAIQRAFG